MVKTRTLYRPTGIHEIALIIQSGLREFPPRLPHQPIFYPVLTYEYAAQIAQQWNARDSPGRAGFVMEFEVDEPFAAQFDEHVVGSARVHREWWVPAEDLAEFNKHISGIIRPVKAFYGDGYSGPEPRTSLAGANVRDQFLHLDAHRRENNIDLNLAVETNWDVVLLNFEWWAGHDFAPDGLSAADRDAALRDILLTWRALRDRGTIPACDPIGAALVAPD